MRARPRRGRRKVKTPGNCQMRRWVVARALARVRASAVADDVRRCERHGGEEEEAGRLHGAFYQPGVGDFLFFHLHLVTCRCVRAGLLAYPCIQRDKAITAKTNWSAPRVPAPFPVQRTVLGKCKRTAAKRY